MGGRKSQKWWANHNLGEGADGLDVDRMRRALNYGADATWAGSGHSTVAQRILAGSPQEPERWGGCVGGHDDDEDEEEDDDNDGFNAAAVDVDALQAEALRLIMSYGGELRTADRDEPEYLLKEALQARLGPRVVGLLLQHADVDFEDEAERGWDDDAPAGSTPLHWSRRADTTRLLLRRGADVDAANDRGVTPLHACIADDECDVDVARALLEAGADANAFATTVQTPLHAALAQHVSSHRRGRLVPLLLAWGADPELVDDPRAMTAPLDDALDGLDAAVEHYEQRDRPVERFEIRRDVEDIVDDIVSAVRVARLVLQAAAWRRRRHLALVVRMRAAASGAPAAGATAADSAAPTSTAAGAAAAGSGVPAPAPTGGAGVRAKLKRAS